MMTISKNISHTGPIELSANLLTIIGGGAEEVKPIYSLPENTKILVDSYKNTFYTDITQTVPINDKVNLIINTKADTTRGVTSGMLSLEIKY